jgi:hypothetical protein
MATIPIAVSNPGTFAYDVSAPTKYTEQLSFELLKLMYAMSSASAVVETRSESYTSAHSYYRSYVSSLNSWYLTASGNIDAGKPAGSPPSPSWQAFTGQIQDVPMELIRLSEELYFKALLYASFPTIARERDELRDALKTAISEIVTSGLNKMQIDGVTGGNTTPIVTASMATVNGLDDISSLLDEIASKPEILNIGSHEVWLKSGAIDEI